MKTPVPLAMNLGVIIAPSICKSLLPTVLHSFFRHRDGGIYFKAKEEPKSTTVRQLGVLIKPWKCQP